MTATAGPRSGEPVAAAGADEVVDHTATEVSEAATGPVDVVLGLAPIDPVQRVPPARPPTVHAQAATGTLGDRAVVLAPAA
ncbi:hypothetical protein ACH4LS_05755 [Streptomyces luteogriseus]|uniref:hypothetical protein n=1 Tax=Streptomyces luteogriseus TaxID=68233 RepID=UPI0036EA3C10